jgi:hypothetical protein
MRLADGEGQPAFMEFLPDFATLAPRPLSRSIEDPGRRSHLGIMAPPDRRRLIAMSPWADETNQVSSAGG